MAIDNFLRAEDRVLDRFGIDAERRDVDMAVVEGQARVLVSGHGTPVMMIIGAGPPAALWAPLLAEPKGCTLLVVEPPGMGLTPPVEYKTATARSTVVSFLDQVRAWLGLERCAPRFTPMSACGVHGLSSN